MRRSILSVTTATLLLLATARPAAAISQRFTTGITLSSISGAGALVAGFGSLVYISDLEYARGWGWLALLSGVGLFAGGVTLSDVENSGARKFSSALLAVGVLSAAIGLAGVILPRAGEPYHAKTPHRASLRPPSGPSVVLLPFVAPAADMANDGSTSAGATGGLALGGVF